MALIMLTPMNVAATRAPSKEVVQNGRIIAFDPSIVSVEKHNRTMDVTIDTVTVAFMYEVQWANKADFSDVHTQFYRNIKNRGCMIIDNNTVKQDGVTYLVRTIWYGGNKISFRKIPKVGKQSRIPVTWEMVEYLRCRYRSPKKKLLVRGKGKYVRVRCIYYGTNDYAYSKWAYEKR